MSGYEPMDELSASLDALDERISEAGQTISNLRVE